MGGDEPVLLPPNIEDVPPPGLALVEELDKLLLVQASALPHRGRWAVRGVSGKGSCGEEGWRRQLRRHAGTSAPCWCPARGCAAPAACAHSPNPLLHPAPPARAVRTEPCGEIRRINVEIPSLSLSDMRRLKATNHVRRGGREESWAGRELPCLLHLWQTCVSPP